MFRNDSESGGVSENLVEVSDQPTFVDLPNYSATNQSSKEWREQSDLGVLFVHGIGQQTQGETLYSFGGALLQWLELWLPARQGSVHVPFAIASPPFLVRRLPAHAGAEIRVKDSAPRRLLLAETWWASDFPPPSLPHVTKWLLMTGSWVVVTHGLNLLFYHFPKLFGPPTKTNVGVDTDRSRGLGSQILATGLLFSATVVTALALSLLQLSLIVLGLLSFIPVRIVQSGVRAALLAIQTFLGDSFSVSTSSLVRGAVIAHIQRDLTWLSKRCSKIMVVAHSQGAALAYEAVRATDSIKIDKLITFGSGLIKLRELRQRSIDTPGWHEALRYIWVVPIVIAVMTPHWLAFAMARLRLMLHEARALGSMNISSWEDLQLVWIQYTKFASALWSAGGLWNYLLIGTFVGLIIALIALQKSGVQGQNYRRQLAQELETLSIEYRDFYATHDPVPSGPLVTSPNSDRILSKRIVNRMSVLRDHMIYWEGFDDFLVKIVTEVEEALGLRLVSQEEKALCDVAATKRHRRVRALSRCRWLLFTAVFIPVIFYFEDVQNLGRSIAKPALSWLPAWVSSVAAFLGDSFVGESVLWSIGVLAPVLIAAIWYRFVASVVWEWWDRLSATALFRGDETVSFAIRALQVFFVFLMALPLIVSIHFTVRGSWREVWSDVLPVFNAIDNALGLRVPTNWAIFIVLILIIRLVILKPLIKQWIFGPKKSS